MIDDCVDSGAVDGVFAFPVGMLLVVPGTPAGTEMVCDDQTAVPNVQPCEVDRKSAGLPERQHGADGKGAP